jgi:signal peptidase I
VSHPILEGEGDNGPLDNTQEFIVDPGHYFAMGDNRDDSLDSRTPQVGQVPAENLIGRAKIIFFSSNGSAHWWEIWKWPFAIRYGRLFHLVK